MTDRTFVDPSALPEAPEGAPACPTGARRPEAEVAPLSPEAEAARRAGLPDAARRALEEADARRAASEEVALPVELGGRKGPEPVRYGDWETKGIAVDF